jgi:hypothetical protein
MSRTIAPFPKERASRPLHISLMDLRAGMAIVDGCDRYALPH